MPASAAAAVLSEPFVLLVDCASKPAADRLWLILLPLAARLPNRAWKRLRATLSCTFPTILESQSARLWSLPTVRELTAKIFRDCRFRTAASNLVRVRPGRKAA